MTEQEVKRIEDQIKDLQSIVKNYYKDQKAISIIQREEDLLGKCFKKMDEKTKETEYFKPISLLCLNTPYKCHGIRFKLPVDPGFDKRSRMFVGYDGSDFDYAFIDDLFIYLDEEETSNLVLNNNKESYKNAVNTGLIDKDELYEEITQDEYEMALADLMFQVAEFSKKPLTLKRVIGDEYEEKIQRILSEQNNENKEISEENKA